MVVHLDLGRFAQVVDRLSTFRNTPTAASLPGPKTTQHLGANSDGEIVARGSLADVCKDAGVVKGSFYHFFEFKEALALAVVEQQWAGQRSCGTASGCLFGNLTLELSNRTETIRVGQARGSAPSAYRGRSRWCCAISGSPGSGPPGPATSAVVGAVSGA
ncbi:TetR/AcrR family transcriptional regulator [Amycolatopsis sp. NPDC051373]|uniref:TetR/AcrR family transcriptional regulator n=1 Tax=Amycolatopsis sp. NPDC051373 TaxID=3155801 RepID=UPI003450072D